MKMTFRWYGKRNPIPIEYVKQIPCVSGVVSEVDAPVGSIWPESAVRGIRDAANGVGLTFEVVESLKVHEDIKLGLSGRDYFINNFIQNLKVLGRNGVNTVCYDFMPVYDWMRTQVRHVLPDRSFTLAYFHDDLTSSDPIRNRFSLDDWEMSYSSTELQDLLEKYTQCTEDDLWDNLTYFIKAVMPEAEKAGVRLGAHPDDPPWSIYGLPRILKNERDLDKLLSIDDSYCNALTLCSGSLGASPENDVPKLITKYAGMGRICFGHVRNLRHLGIRDFVETSHYSHCGSLDIVGIMRAYHESGFEGPLRCDHGRMIFGEDGMAGYGLYDRALGAMYLSGIWDGLRERVL